MKKISTLFKKDPNDLGRVINEVDPQNKWVLDGEGYPTRKFDGTACLIMGNEIYKRYDVKKGKTVPDGAIPCQEPDKITGHWPHWVKCDRNNPADKWHFEAFDKMIAFVECTYELCGPKIGVNAERLESHTLIRHGSEILPIDKYDFESIKTYLSDSKNDIEGIVFHHKIDTRKMCKIRKCDFGIKR